MNAALRTPFVCANWKLNHLWQDTQRVLETMIDESGDLSSVDLVVAPVATLLDRACILTQSTSIKIAGQNVFHEPHGAFTGEWSAEHLRELGCKYAIVGHSERRQYFAETDAFVAKKIKACFDHLVTPIACVGETFGERKSGHFTEVLQRQTNALLSLIEPDQISHLIIAYEPVWAIGTGLSATSAQAQEVHAFIRALVQEKFGTAASQATRIIYGGSVKLENAAELAAQQDIDGALIGGASLLAQSFLGIARFFVHKVS